MLNQERQQQIINILKQAGGFVTVGALCETLFASASSIRRDLTALEKRGLVKKSYGGATLMANFSSITSFYHRTHDNVEAKRAIARKAATLIQDGDIIFLDQSSTAFYLAAELMERTGLTVVTNNTEILMLLSESTVKVICSGGTLSSANRSCLVDIDAAATFEKIYADFAFFSVNALSQDGIISDCSQEEVFVRASMLKNAKTKVLLCDSSKFGTRAPFRQCSLADVDCLISEETHAENFVSFADTLKLL